MNQLKGSIIINKSQAQLYLLNYILKIVTILLKRIR
jgi:hypothetical protein